MSQPRLDVSFACNDDRGHFDGRFEHIDFHSDLGIEASLVGPSTMLQITTPNGPEAQVTTVLVGGTLRLSATGHRRWEGNMAWDGCSMRLSAARVLLLWLLHRGFTVEEQALEGPLVDILEKKRQ
jgi:hypothetical protein